MSRFDETLGLYVTEEYEIYHTVIDDVIAKLEGAFIEEGVDESVLQELKELWVAKLTQTKAVDAPTKKPPVHQMTPTASGNKIISAGTSSFINISKMNIPNPQVDIKSDLSQLRPLFSSQMPQTLNKQPSNLLTCRFTDFNTFSQKQLAISRMPAQSLTATLLAQKHILPLSKQNISNQMIVVQNIPCNNSGSTGSGQIASQTIGQTILFPSQQGLRPQIIANNINNNQLARSTVMNIQQIRNQLQILPQVQTRGQTQLQLTQQQQFIFPSNQTIRLPHPSQVQQNVQSQSIIINNGQLRHLNNFINSTSICRPNGQLVTTRPVAASLQQQQRTIQPTTSQRSIQLSPAIRQEFSLGGSIVSIGNLPAGVGVPSGYMFVKPERINQFDGTSSIDLFDDDDEEIADMLDSESAANDIEVDDEDDEADEKIGRIGIDDVTNSLTADNIDDAYDCDNLMACLYEKVIDSRSKFKVILKFGILSINGKDKIFKSACGELSF